MFCFFELSCDMVFLRCLDSFVEFVSVGCVFLDVFDGRVVDSEVV